MENNHCPKCDIIMKDGDPHGMLCEECFYVEFERVSGRKSEWLFNKEKNEWEQVYKNMGFKQ